VFSLCIQKPSENVLKRQGVGGGSHRKKPDRSKDAKGILSISGKKQWGRKDTSVRGPNPLGILAGV